ncbi:hypothetical protein SUSAZ_07855 [Sulfolobus acidocaldarius SUSAZ]|nr:hypothetical protein SUSAZ_07855 [Sulfolobus acidocaldarius SUSAZ]
MMFKGFKTLIVFYISSLIIALIPTSWWYYSAGGIANIYDSPFLLRVEFLGSYVIIVNIVNILLTAFRIYVIVNIVYALIYIFRKKQEYKYTTMAWLPVLYIIDPILTYLVLKFALPNYANYPFIIFGQETFTIHQGNTTASLLIVSEPTIAFWISFIPTIAYVAYLIIKRL